MLESEVLAAKADLDSRNKIQTGHINIAFGADLWAEFVARGWIKMADFDNVAFPDEPLRLPSYENDAFAFPSTEIAPNSFSVGRGGFNATRS